MWFNRQKSAASSVYEAEGVEVMPVLEDDEDEEETLDVSTGFATPILSFILVNPLLLSACQSDCSPYLSLSTAIFLFVALIGLHYFSHLIENFVYLLIRPLLLSLLTLPMSFSYPNSHLFRSSSSISSHFDYITILISPFPSFLTPFIPPFLIYAIILPPPPLFTQYSSPLLKIHPLLCFCLIYRFDYIYFLNIRIASRRGSTSNDRHH